MAFIPVPNTALVELVFTLFGQVVENTLYFQSDHAMTESDLAQLLLDVHGWVTGHLLSLMAGDALVNRLQATALDTDMSPVSIFVPHTSENGSSAGGAAPGGTTLAVGFKSAGRGRSSRGRNYIVGIPLAAVSGNQVIPGYAANVLIEYAELALVVWTDAAIQHVIVSRQHNGVALSVGTTYPVTAYVLANWDVDSQRRRLTGRGM